MSERRFPIRRARAALHQPDLATFWRGPLNALAYACLASFAHVGSSVTVYSYEEGIDLPRGARWADARLICPDQSLISRYLAGGKPSLAKFADMFRYKLIRDTGCCWVDTDVFCLRAPDLSGESIIFGRQPEAHGQSLINNAVLRLPPEHPVLRELIDAAEAAVDVDQSWGAIGPFLLTEIAERNGIGRYARAPFDFYPVDPDYFWKPLLPADRNEVAAASERSTFLHLWGELYDRAGIDRSLAPPPGSFLHDAILRAGVLGRFKGVYDAESLENIVARWVANRETLSPMATPQ